MGFDLVVFLRDMGYSHKIARQRNDGLGKEKLKIYKSLAKGISSPKDLRKIKLIVGRQLEYFEEIRKRVEESEFSDYLKDHFAEAYVLRNDARPHLVWLIQALRQQKAALAENPADLDAFRSAVKSELARYRYLEDIVRRARVIIEKESRRDWSYHEGENLAGILVASTFLAMVFGLFYPDIFDSLQNFAISAGTIVAVKHIKYIPQFLSQRKGLKNMEKLLRP